jgi:general secretion pathway protein I
VRRRRGFTLLELIVATTIMAIAVVGLIAGLSNSTRNATRLLDYDRAVQLARLRMNDLLLDQRIPLNVRVEGRFDPAISGGLDAGWRARVSTAEMPPAPAPGQTSIQRVELEVWWTSGAKERSFALEGYRFGKLRDEDIPVQAVPR